MKLFGKRTDKKQPVVPTNMPRTGVVTSIGIEESRKHHIHLPKLQTPKLNLRRFVPSKKVRKIGAIALLAILVLGAAAFAVMKYQASQSHKTAAAEMTEVNKAYQANDTSQALKHARQVMAADPHNPDSIILVASLTSKDNPKEAKQLYARALDEFKKQDNPDVDGKHAVTYWAAAGLAEKAGENDQAKKYYQKVIDTADLADAYEQTIVAQSEAALRRLK